MEVKKQKEISLYYKNFLTLLSGHTISHLIPFIVAPIISRIFTPSDFSVFANFMAIVGMLGIVATGRLELAIPLPKDDSKAQNLVFTGLLITFGLTILSLVFPIFSEQIGDLYKDHKISSYLWLIPFGVVSYGLLATANNWILRKKQFKFLTLTKVIQSLVNNGLSVLLGYIGWGVDGLIFGLLISQYVGIFISCIPINKNVSRRKTEFNIPLAKSILREYKDFPLINSLHAFMDIFATQFLLFWIITSVYGDWKLGVFAMMFKYIKGPIGLITTSVSQIFYVETSQAMHESKAIFPIFKRTIQIAFAFAIPFGLAILFFGPQLFKWYLGTDWELGGAYAQCILPVLMFTFIVSPVSGMTILFKKQFTGFLLSLGSYFLSITFFMVAVYFKLALSTALFFYSAAFSIYYIIILMWYYRLIKIHDEQIIINNTL